MHNSVLNDLKNLASKDLTNATAMPKELYSSNEILNVFFGSLNLFCLL